MGRWLLQVQRELQLDFVVVHINTVLAALGDVLEAFDDAGLLVLTKACSGFKVNAYEVGRYALDHGGIGHFWHRAGIAVEFFTSKFDKYGVVTTARAILGFGACQRRTGRQQYCTRKAGRMMFQTASDHGRILLL